MRPVLTSRRALLGLGASFFLSRNLASGQSPAFFSSNVDVINILAIVRSKHGELVNNLTAQNFRILEDGRLQVIRYFSKETDLPLTVALLVDCSLSQAKMLKDEARAAPQFLDDVVRPGKDKRMVVEFDHNVRILADVSSPHSQTFPLNLPNDRQPGNVLYDAIYTVCFDHLALQTGRKAMVILADGLSYKSRHTLNDAILSAIKSNVIIYTIPFSDPSFFPSPYASHVDLVLLGRTVLRTLAESTGGRFMDVSSSHNIKQLLVTIAAELRSQYSIGYISDRPSTKPELRKVVVQTMQRGLMVQARRSYFAQPANSNP